MSGATIRNQSVFRCAALGLGLLSACSDAPPPRPDSGEIYGMFQNAAAFAAAVDRLDILCGGTGPRDRVAQIRARAAGALDVETNARLESFIAEQMETARNSFEGELCGIELSEDRKTYAEVFQEHSRRLEAALALRAN